MDGLLNSSPAPAQACEVGSNPFEGKQALPRALQAACNVIADRVVKALIESGELETQPATETTEEARHEH